MSFEHLKRPYTLNSEYVPALSSKADVNTLFKDGFIFDYPTDDDQASDLVNHLNTHFDGPLYYVGYVFRRFNTNRTIMDMYFRCSSETFPLLDNSFYISQEYLFLDFDLENEKGEKRKWTDTERVGILATIANHPVLKNSIFYITEHGFRCIFRITPLRISSQTNAEHRIISPTDFVSAYRNFVGSLDKANLPNGHFDVGSPANPFGLFRHPNCVKENGKDLRGTKVHLPSILGEIELLHYATESVKKESFFETKAFEYTFDTSEEESFFYDTALAVIYTDPLFKKAREERLHLSYPVWRALGTNICAITKLRPEHGFQIFKEFSSWDPSYAGKVDEYELRKHWGHICSSVNEYGCVTYKSILENDSPLNVLEPELAEVKNSSPAGKAWQTARKTFSARYNKAPISSNIVAANKVKSLSQSSSSGKNNNASGDAPNLPASCGVESYIPTIGMSRGMPAPTHSGLAPDEVKELLRKTTVTKGETSKEVVQKSIVNLEIILENDVAYCRRFTRNILGFRNEYNRKEIQEELYTRIRTDIASEYGIQFGKEDIIDKIKELCARYLYNPIYDYLAGLPQWDGKDRSGEVLEALGVLSSDPNYDIYKVYIRKWFVSCVCRPMQWMKDDNDRTLNDKVDTVMVFKGNQGLKKSTFFAEILPSPNLFSDSLQRIETNEKDASTHMLNYWLIEFAELDGLVKKSSIEALKGFISRRRERFRPPYGRTEINARRPSILVGTTNSDQFLNDPSGSRRFWAIELTESKKIDIEYIRQNRDQIWAQAISLFMQGGDYCWWLDEAEQEASDAANEKFKKRDPWDEYIETYLGKDPTIKNRHGFRIQSVFEEALGMKAANVNPYEVNRVKRILERKGYEEARERISVTENEQKVERLVRVWRLTKPELREEE
jgi:predicted P-loop ATPase